MKKNSLFGKPEDKPISAEKFREISGKKQHPGIPAKAQSKFRNKKTVVDNIVFDSKLEANYYIELKGRRALGLIEFETQVKYPLHVNGQLIATYIADFVVTDLGTGDVRVEDTKGVLTDVFRLKRKLMKAVHGIDVHIVRENKVKKIANGKNIKTKRRARRTNS